MANRDNTPYQTYSGRLKANVFLWRSADFQVSFLCRDSTLEELGAIRNALDWHIMHGGTGGDDRDDFILSRRAGVSSGAQWSRVKAAVLSVFTLGANGYEPTDALLGFVGRRFASRAGRPFIPTEIRRAVFERDGYLCVLCRSEDRLSIDHIVPFSRGGPDTEQNLRVLCMPCNIRRGNRE